MPGSVGAIKAGRAFLELFVNDKSFQSGLARSLQQLNTFGRQLTTIGNRIGLAGAALTTPFVLALRQFAKAGPEANAFRAALDSLRSSSTQVSTAIGTALTPAITAVVGKFAELAPAIAAFIRDNSALVTAVAAFAAGLTILGPLIASVGLALTGIVTLVTALASPVGALVTAVTALGVAFGAAALNSDKFRESLKNLGGEALETIKMLRKIDQFKDLLGDISSGNINFNKIAKARGEGPLSSRRPRDFPIGGVGGNFLIQVIPEALRPRGKPGFNIEDTQRQFEDFTRGTFSGRLAPQILGGGSTVARHIGKIAEEASKQRLHLENIDRKIGVGPQHKFGLA